MVHFVIFCIAQFRLHRFSIESVYIEITVNIEVTAIVGLIQYSEFTRGVICTGLISLHNPISHSSELIHYTVGISKSGNRVRVRQGRRQDVRASNAHGRENQETSETVTLIISPNPSKRHTSTCQTASDKLPTGPPVSHTFLY